MSKIPLASLLKQTWPLARGLFWAGLWLFSLGILAWFSLRWWPGDRFWPVRLVNYFMPWLLVGLIPGLLVAGLVRRRWLALALAGPTLFIGLTFAPLFWPHSNLVLAGNESLKVMSYNIWAYNQNLAATAAVIRQAQPDILLMQEVTPLAARTLTQALIDLYPDERLHITYDSEIGQAVISRYPLTPLGHPTGRTQKVLVDTPHGLIAVWNIHARQPYRWRWQYRETIALIQDIAANNGPLIVGGDFNTTDQSETYRLINQYLHNAHWEAGWGFGFSFPAPSRRLEGMVPVIPVVRIDHIFYSADFVPYNARTLSDSGGSDHLPVVTTLHFSD